MPLSEETLIGLFSAKDVGLAVAKVAGARSIGALRALSRAIADLAQEVHLPHELWLPRGSIYVCGGWNARPESAERYDPVVGAWERLPPMAQGRQHTCAVALFGHLLVYGGYDSGEPLLSVERFDPATGQWVALGDLLDHPLRFGAATAISATWLYVCGGLHAEESFFVRAADRFDLATSEWEPLPPMAQERMFAAAAFCGESLYVCGGASDDRTRKSLTSAERFDLSTSAWEPLPPMLRARYQAAAASMSGRLYVLGGIDGFEILDSVEVFDPASCSWDSARPMLRKRAAPAAVAKAGRLYILGGADDQHDPQNAAERFDAVRGSWEPLPAMLEARSCMAVAVVEQP